MVGTGDDRHNLRLTRALKVRIRHAAADNERSVNAEIVARLEQSFAPDPATRLAAALRPLAYLKEDDQRRAVELLAAALAILAQSTETDAKE